MTEREQKKAWLNRGYPLKLELIGLKAELAERYSRAEYSGIQYGSIGSGSHGCNGTDQKLKLIEETEAEIERVEAELAAIETEVREAIEQVTTPIYRTYLRMRFLCYKKEPEIAEETGYSLDHVDGYIRRKAIDSVKLTANNG